MLAVVEDDEHRSASDESSHQPHRVDPGLVDEPEDLAHSPYDVAASWHGGQVDPPDAVAESVEGHPRDLEGEAGLADAAETRHRDESLRVEPLDDLGDLQVPSDEGRQRRREVVRGFEVEVGVLAKDPILEEGGLRCGVEPELLAESLPKGEPGAQGVGLPSCAVEGEHQELMESLAVGVRADERLELWDGGIVLAEVELRLDRQLRCVKAHRGEFRGPSLHDQRSVREAAEGIPAPEGLGPVEQCDGADGVGVTGALRPGDEVHELIGVDVVAGGVDAVVVAVGPDPPVDRRLEVRHVGAHDVRGGGGCALAPDRLDQGVRAQLFRAGGEEGGEHPLLTWAPEVDVLPVIEHTQGAEECEFHVTTACSHPSYPPAAPPSGTAGYLLLPRTQGCCPPFWWTATLGTEGLGTAGLDCFWIGVWDPRGDGRRPT